ncbi:MAG: 4-(cytidine 5'-diphospho)-2-C-methyl-D-erythritol kinase [Opitutaceae bacterium]|nr:4-(cytidine 5'-diphospho)-2-C-methyl-D-erythritol kinase [Opitutaceae bacterium]
MNASPSISVFAPAKLNLFLAVTGRRSDGFHDLVSLVAPVDFGDTLRLVPDPGQEAASDSLECTTPGVPTDASNLVLKAAAAWRAAGGRAPWMRFGLEKHTPAGAGMGGGSSDAVAALRGLQELAEVRVPLGAIAPLAAALGSDCPLFLVGGPTIIRGRGERLEVLSAAERARLEGQRVLICRPGFGIDTPWAYARLAAGAPHTYMPAKEADGRLAAWRAGVLGLEELLANSFEAVAFAKYAALPVLAARLRERHGLRLHLTGSGSACFALLEEGADASGALAEVRAAWGPEALAVETRLGGDGKSV